MRNHWGRLNSSIFATTTTTRKQNWFSMQPCSSVRQRLSTCLWVQRASAISSARLTWCASWEVKRCHLSFCIFFFNMTDERYSISSWYSWNYFVIIILKNKKYFLFILINLSLSKFFRKFSSGNICFHFQRQLDCFHRVIASQFRQTQ